MSLSPRARHLETTAALRELLLSDSMHADQATCVASGKFPGVARQSTSKPLPELASC
jgi:hypothetical protein